MKKLLVVLMVLSMATIANAGLTISVNGVDNPPDTSVELQASETARIDIHGDGQTPSPMSLFLIAEGLGTMSGGVMVYPGSLATFGYAPPADITMLQGLGYNTINAAKINLADGAVPPAPLAGVLVDYIDFHCDVSIPPNDVLLTLMNLTWVYDEENETYIPNITVFDTQIIHQIPEPFTMALLGLGGLFLRRRK